MSLPPRPSTFFSRFPQIGLADIACGALVIVSVLAVMTAILPLRRHRASRPPALPPSEGSRPHRYHHHWHPGQPVPHEGFVPAVR